MGDDSPYSFQRKEAIGFAKEIASSNRAVCMNDLRSCAVQPLYFSLTSLLPRLEIRHREFRDLLEHALSKPGSCSQ